ncbi:MAG: bifunctional adenosylcobinamide kinase/adenosylcobinamide-phosphate guanylyltransferase [Bacillota bacterium]|nr:bifunctional adenosylcobinamide kinase/adenosylcobinamide-phosphate guanylyltransferase [Bacillota bacterium]
MGEIILVTGGARSGKSTYAEERAKKYGSKILYVATSLPLDEEMRQRIAKHREQRPEEWETIEAYSCLDSVIKCSLAGKNAVMLDCITIMITNLMFDKCSDWENISSDEISAVEEYVKTEMDKLVCTARQAEIPFILVTNELGMGVVPEYASARIFRDIAGRMNQYLAKEATEVYLCVSGIPVRIK